jgi:hypothetical protein
MPDVSSMNKRRETSYSATDTTDNTCAESFFADSANFAARTLFHRTFAAFRIARELRAQFSGFTFARAAFKCSANVMPRGYARRVEHVKRNLMREGRGDAMKFHECS